MLLIFKHIKNIFLNELDENIDEKYIFHGIPIKFKEYYLILTSLGNLDLSTIINENCDNISTKYEIDYIVNNNINGTINIHNVISMHKININTDINQYNCFYDEHLNLLFLKFQDMHIEYLEIPFQEINKLVDYSNMNLLVNINWISNKLTKKTLKYNIKNKYVIDDKFINLPPIPLIILNTNDYVDLDAVIINQLDQLDQLPLTGSNVFDEKNNFIGMINNIDQTKIIIITLSLISRSLNYLENIKLPELYFDTAIAEINLTNILNKKITTQYGLYLKYDYINHHKELKNSNSKRIKELKHTDLSINISEQKKLKDNSIILSIDNLLFNKDGEIKIDKNILLPLSTYIWLYKGKINNIEIKIINGSILKDIHIPFNDANININDHNIAKILKFTNIKYNFGYLNDNSTLNTKTINFIKYKKKYLIELNEQILQKIKPILTSSRKYNEINEYIWNNRFSKDKIIILFDTNNMYIKQINNIGKNNIHNLDNIYKYFKNNSTKLRDYIISI